MFLLINIGNSHFTCGITKGNDIFSRILVKNDEINFLEKIENIFLNPDIKKVIFSSVVPIFNEIIIGYAEKYNIPYKHIKYYDDVDLKLDIENPETVGVDRLLITYAARDKTDNPLMVIDMGTATTYNILSKEKIFLGGTIGTGFHMMRMALHEKTAKLPLVDMVLDGDTDIKIVGRNTQDAILSGVFWGYICQIKGMIELYQQQFPDIYVIATGGMAPYICKYIDRIDDVDNHLLLKGLLKIATRL